MAGWTNVTRVGRVFAQGVTMQNYFPDVQNISGVANHPWSVNCYGSTDHSSTGGIYAGGCRVGEDKADPSSYETYDEALARGAFDYLVTKPAGNPIYTDTDSGYGSTETPCIGKVGSEYLMTAQVGVTGSDQPTFLTITDDLINFTNYDRGDGEPFVIDGGIDDNFPAKDQHRGYFGWAENPFTGVGYTYCGYGLHGGGDKPLNAFYGSNDGKNWTTIAIVSDYQFPDNIDVPADWGIWWNGIDVRGIRDAGGGEYSMVVSIADLNHGGAGRESKLYEIFVADDGVTVTRQPRLLLDVGGLGAPDSDEVSAPMFVNDNGQWLMFYQGADISSLNSLMLATIDWDETQPKPTPITRPNHKKLSVHRDDGSFPAGISVENGTPTFNGNGIEFTSNERIEMTEQVVPSTAGYLEVFIRQSGNGTNTARLINTVADSLSTGRAVNGVENTTYSGGVYIQQSVGGSGLGEDVTTFYPVNQNNTKSDIGIRWDVADERLWLLVGEGQCKNIVANTPDVDPSLAMNLMAGNINFGTVSAEEVTFRVGTSANDGVAPEVSGTVASSTEVAFTMSSNCIGDGTGIVVKNNGVPVAGTVQRTDETTFTFTRETSTFNGTLTYDVTDPDVRNREDLVSVQNVAGVSIDFTPPVVPDDDNSTVTPIHSPIHSMMKPLLTNPITNPIQGNR